MKPKQTPPHLETPEQKVEREALESGIFDTKPIRKYSLQGPSKYGKGGSRVHHAKSRKKK